MPRFADIAIFGLLLIPAVGGLYMYWVTHVLPSALIPHSTSVGKIVKTYQVNLHFEVAGEPVTATGVWQTPFDVLDGGNGRISLTTSDYVSADAIFVPLPGGEPLVTLNSLDDARRTELGRLLPEICGIPKKSEDGTGKDWLHRIEMLSAPCPIPKDDLPIFVTYSDPADAQTLTRVDLDHPELTVGADVHFVGAEFTFPEDATPSQGILERLPMLTNGSLLPRTDIRVLGRRKPGEPEMMQITQSFFYRRNIDG